MKRRADGFTRTLPVTVQAHPSGKPYRVAQSERAIGRVESVTEVEATTPGWIAYDLVIRPLDKRGRVNGRAKRLSTMHIEGPVGAIDVTGALGQKATISYP